MSGSSVVITASPGNLGCVHFVGFYWNYGPLGGLKDQEVGMDI